MSEIELIIKDLQLLFYDIKLFNMLKHFKYAETLEIFSPYGTFGNYGVTLFSTNI